MLFRKLQKNAVPDGEEGRLIRERFKNDGTCRHCGQCCHQGFIVGSMFILIPELPCKYLASDGNGGFNCEVYEKRRHVEWCNPCNEKTVKQGLFPPDCSYVQGVINYHGKMLPPDADRDKVRKALRRRVKYMPRPDCIRARDWANFLKSLYEDS